LVITGALALRGLGLFAGTVLGGDGSVETADRLEAPGDTTIQTARSLSGPVTAGKRGAKKPKVVHGRGQPIAIDSRETNAISLRCPKKFPVPLSAGLDTSAAGIFPNAIYRDPDAKRAMLVIATNTTEAAGQWTATSACMKGAKEA
jgi:hypothetical protein